MANKRSFCKLRTSSTTELLFSSLPITDAPAELDVALFSGANEVFGMIREVFGSIFKVLKDEEALAYFQQLGLELL
jgi:hypothetical protein